MAKAVDSIGISFTIVSFDDYNVIINIILYLYSSISGIKSRAETKFNILDRLGSIREYRFCDFLLYNLIKVHILVI